MNAKERALEYLKTNRCYEMEHYNKIDILIEPLCKLLNKNGYITLHSCSGHVSVRVGMPKKGHFGIFLPHNKKQWYVLFIATNPIENINKIVKKINIEHDISITLKEIPDDFLMDRWILEVIINGNYNDNYLYNLNKLIYSEFKNLNIREKIE